MLSFLTKLWILYSCFLVSCSWYQSTKQPILFFPIFSTNFSQLEQLKRIANFFIGPKQIFFSLSFGPMKSLFSFSTAKNEKRSWKKLGKTRFVVWWFDVTNWLLMSNFWAFFLVFHLYQLSLVSFYKKL